MTHQLAAKFEPGQFSLRSGMMTVTLVALIFGISQFAIHVIIFAAAFTLGLKCLQVGFKRTGLRSLVWGVVGFCLVYAFSVGPILLTSRFLAHGLPQPNVFEACADIFADFYGPVYEMAEGYAQKPIYWYSDSWLVDRRWTTNVTNPGYLVFLVVFPWWLVFALLGFLLSQQERRRAAWACGGSCLAFTMLAVAASTTFW